MTHGGAAAVLPDDGVMDGLAGGAIPQQTGFALVGDSDGGQSVERDPGGGFTAHGDRCHPNLFGVVLDPTVLRVVLGERALSGGDDHAGTIKDNGPRAASPLVDGEQVVWGGHDTSFCRNKANARSFP